MRVLILNDYGTPSGGAELISLTLRDGLRVRGHDARFFSSSAKPLNIDNKADYVCFGTTTRFRTLLQSCNPMAAYKLRQVIDKFHPDIIHVRMFLTQLSPLVLTVLKKSRSLLHVVNYRPVCPTNLKILPNGSPCHYPYGSACYRNRCLPIQDWIPLMLQMKVWELLKGVFSLIVTNSGSVAKRLAQNGLKTDMSIWNGVPVTPARPPLKSEPVVAFAGRLESKKGVDILIQAIGDVVRKLPQCRLLVAGEGPERQKLKLLISGLGLNQHVTMLGYRSRRELDKLLASAWVQVVPSVWEEPFGLVAAEAMMRGTAVVASNTGGLGEIVQHGKTGFHVNPGCSKSLSEALLKILTNKKRAETMGKQSRRYALSELSEDRMIDRFIAVYQELNSRSLIMNHSDVACRS